MNNKDGSISNELAKMMKVSFFHVKLGIPLPITYEKLIYFYGHETFMKEYDKIMTFVPHLETELVKILNQVANHHLLENRFNGVNYHPYALETGRDKSIAETVYKYFQQMKELKTYYDDAAKRIIKRKKVTQRPVIVNR